MTREINIPPYMPLIDLENKSVIEKLFFGFFNNERFYYSIVSQDHENILLEKINKKNVCLERALKIALFITPFWLIGLGCLIYNLVSRRKHHYFLLEKKEKNESISTLRQQRFASQEESRDIEKSNPSSQLLKVSTHQQKPESCYPFIIKVKTCRENSKVLKEVEVTIVPYGNCSGSLFFDLISKSDGHVLGQIRLREIGNAIEIEQMDTYKTYPSENVGKAMHEFAIRYSFLHGFEGCVELDATNQSDGFHFKCGYRYKKPQHIGYSQFLKFCEKYGEAQAPVKMKEFSNICEHYQQTSESSLEKEIVNHFAYHDLQEGAEKELGRKAYNLHEAIDYGIYLFWDANTILERFYSDDKPNCKSQFCHPVNKRFSFGGTMILVESERIKWKRIIEES